MSAPLRYIVCHSTVSGWDVFDCRERTVAVTGPYYRCFKRKREAQMVADFLNSDGDE